MNKMIFVAALLLTACSPNQSQDEVGNLQNTIQIDSTPDNNVQQEVVTTPPAQPVKVGAITRTHKKEWVDDYEPCVESTNDTSACQKKAELSSGITSDDKNAMADGADDAIRRLETVYKPCMAKFHDDKKCSDLYENFDDQGNRVKDPD